MKFVWKLTLLIGYNAIEDNVVVVVVVVVVAVVIATAVGCYYNYEDALCIEVSIIYWS